MSGVVRFSADYAKRVSSCKKCKQKIEKGLLRIAKVVPNPFSEEADEMRQYYHGQCLFGTFKTVRSAKIIESADDIENWSDLVQNDKNILLDLIKKIESSKTVKTSKSPKKIQTPSKGKKVGNEQSPSTSKVQKKLDDIFTPKSPKTKPSNTEIETKEKSEKNVEPKSQYDSLDQFNKLCDRMASIGSYLQKTQIVRDFITDGSDEGEYNGDVYLLLKLLLPGVIKRVYNVNSKQLVKLYSQIFNVDYTEMLDDLNSKGDISETVASYFEESSAMKPMKTSCLSLQEVDSWLEEMTQYTRDDDQQRHLAKITKKCNRRDLVTIIRLIKHDLRINAGAKHILEALDKNAYAAFQSSRDLKLVVERIAQHNNSIVEDGSSPSKLHASIHLGVPCLPMLAEVCRSTEYAMKKCPSGMYAEVKYDGERVQIHKDGSKFHFFSRSLKSVQRHKIEFLEKFIPEAFPGGESLILDAEVLLVDNEGKPLPFGTLGVHKKTAFRNANVCLFVFDCLLYQNESLMNKPLKERKELLDKHMTEIKNHVMLSEMKFLKHGDNHTLSEMINRAIKEGLEGLMIKDVNSIYEPGKRHWLKIKKDYLMEGSMADTADLIVLGAYYGTGNKGGMMSVFLMGCHDPKTDKFLTVTKCGNGHDDAALERINKELEDHVIKISKDFSKIPKWLSCNRQLVPDFVVKNPKAAPVWEITGAEFSSAEAHTADGISIRFPRVTKIRADKDWETATNLQELKKLYKKSKEKADFYEIEEASSSLQSPEKRSKRKSERSEDSSDVVDASPKKRTKVDRKNNDNDEGIFQNLIFYLPSEFPRRDYLLKLIAHLGGTVSEEKSLASHIVSTETVKLPKSKDTTKFVDMNWIKRCAIDRALLPIDYDN